MDASVVIPARNASATLPATLAALAAQRGASGYELLLVDDGSRDDTVALARSFDALPLKLLETGGGAGPGAARNLGAAHARGKLLVFLDADCRPEPDWLARMVRTSRDAELVQGAVLLPQGVHAGPFDRFIVVVSEYGLYQTANLAITRELFARIGGFESIVMPWRSKEMGEDVWLAWRARRAGARTTFAADAVVRHAVFPRGPLQYLGEQTRVRFFPALVHHVPELREVSLYRRWFLSGRSARFDLALAGAGAAVALHSPLPLAAALPYARILLRDSAHWGRRRQPLVAPAHICADFVRAAALAWGSLRYRTPVV